MATPFRAGAIDGQPDSNSIRFLFNIDSIVPSTRLRSVVAAGRTRTDQDQRFATDDEERRDCIRSVDVLILRQRATRYCWPPERSARWRSRRSSIPLISTASSPSVRSPRYCGRSRTSVEAHLLPSGLGVEHVDWNTIEAFRFSGLVGHRLVVEPDFAVGHGLQPGDTGSVVVFPQPLEPTSTMKSRPRFRGLDRRPR